MSICFDILLATNQNGATAVKFANLAMIQPKDPSMADRQNIDAEKGRAVHNARPHVSEHHDPAFADGFPPHLDTDLLVALRDATMDPDPRASKIAVLDALAQGARPEDLADYYIPTIARELGDRWCVDQLSFAGVTIGASRLQAMMRELGPNWTSDKAADPAAPSILLLVMQDVYHTLGAIVLSSQLRRKGLSVKLVLGAKSEDVAERLQRTSYQAVFISSSCGETLESLRRIIDVIKTSTPTPPPIVVGGTILAVETVNDVTALTGADYATRLPDEALRLCGLQVIKQDTAHARDET